MMPAATLDHLLRTLGLAPSRMEVTGRLRLRRPGASLDRVAHVLAEQAPERPTLREARQRGPLVLREFSALDRFGGVLWERRPERPQSARDEPEALVLDALDPIVRAVGAVESLAAGRWTIDLRSSRAGVRFADFAVVVLEGEVLAVQPKDQDGAGDELAAAVPEPELRALVGGRPVEGWLRAHFEALAREATPLSRCMAVGLVGRLWGPDFPRRVTGAARPRAESSDPGWLSAELKALLSGDAPVFSARRWYAELPEPVRAAVEEAACAGAERLAGRLPSLERRYLSGQDGWRELAQRWLTMRDDLGSVEFLAAGAEGLPELPTALRRVDRDGSALRAAMGAALVLQDARLRRAWSSGCGVG